MVPSGPHVPPNRTASAALSQMEWGKPSVMLNRFESCRTQKGNRLTVRRPEIGQNTLCPRKPPCFEVVQSGESKGSHRPRTLENVRPAKLWECCR